MRKTISIVTPCYNEQDNVEIAYKTVAALFDGPLKDYQLEYIFADNASDDETVARLEAIAAKDPRVKVIVNANNFGVFRSMFNGLLATSGDASIPFLPADLQDPPSLIPEFVKLWEQGYKVVYGQRDKREEPFVKSMLRKLYYRFVARMSKNKAPLDAGEFQLIDRQVVDALRQYDDYQPYLRGMIAACGFKSTGIKYTWAKRERGLSKAGLFAMFDQGLNGMVSSTAFPIRIGMMAGLVISALSILFAFLNVILYLFDNNIADRGIMTLIVGTFFFGGVQLFFVCLVGEYVASIHSQVRRGPLVVEDRRINFTK